LKPAVLFSLSDLLAANYINYHINQFYQTMATSTIIIVIDF